MKIVEIDRSQSLAQQAHTGHNRWHPDIPAIVEADPEEEVVLQTRDSMDGQFNAKTTEADFTKLNAGLIHPLTGPVFIKGAKPGDLLEVEFVDIRPEPFAFTCIVPGLGFLPDVFSTPFIAEKPRMRGWGRGVTIGMCLGLLALGPCAFCYTMTLS